MPGSSPVPRGPVDFIPQASAVLSQQMRAEQANTASPPTAETVPNANSVLKKADENNKAASKPTAAKSGVEALDEMTLRVSLELPDKDLPKLVANPVFRPIYGDGVEFDADPLDTGVVTNGAFSVLSVDKEGIALGRSQTYWGVSDVSLDSVRFVPRDNAEAALLSYKKGEIDAITNAEFEPLVLKLLAPYDDFRQTTHSALNFYEFNTSNPPFNDRRVREAMAFSIDRDRLTVGELESSAQPASSFLPLGERENAKFVLDVDRAKQLLEKAGFPKGEGFPKIRLLINRNDTQQRVARLIARMWKQNLNLDTEIDVKDPAELENVRASGQYDLIRRGIVLPTGDETVSLAAIFGNSKKAEVQTKTAPKDAEKTIPPRTEPPAQGPHEGDSTDLMAIDEPAPPPDTLNNMVTEEAAVFEIEAIPLYFPMSYSLVKPYVKGFETNGLDAPILKDISIDNDWRPKTTR